MEKVGTPKDEPMVHPMVSSSIERAQKRVEMQNFSIRKHLLEYDDVMNQQRSVIYKLRNEILDSTNLTHKYNQFIEDFAEYLIDVYTDPKEPPLEWDWSGIESEFSRIYLIRLPLDDEETRKNIDLNEFIIAHSRNALDLKREILGPEITYDLMRWSLLTTIDTKWMVHLHAMDSLKEGIGLQSFAQKDPLIEYKKEGYDTFIEMLEDITREALVKFFHTQIKMPEQPRQTAPLRVKHESVGSFAAAVAKAESTGGAPPAKQLATSDGSSAKAKTIRRRGSKVKRNDPCPCGSGKKYKNCCGQE
jgi:preprotein translocase subunit SecA